MLNISIAGIVDLTECVAKRSVCRYKTIPQQSSLLLLNRRVHRWEVGRTGTQGLRRSLQVQDIDSIGVGGGRMEYYFPVQ